MRAKTFSTLGRKRMYFRRLEFEKQSYIGQQNLASLLFVANPLTASTSNQKRSQLPQPSFSFLSKYQYLSYLNGKNSITSLTLLKQTPLFPSYLTNPMLMMSTNFLSVPNEPFLKNQTKERKLDQKIREEDKTCSDLILSSGSPDSLSLLNENPSRFRFLVGSHFFVKNPRIPIFVCPSLFPFLPFLLSSSFLSSSFLSSYFLSSSFLSSTSLPLRWYGFDVNYLKITNPGFVSDFYNSPTKNRSIPYNSNFTPLALIESFKKRKNIETQKVSY